LNEIASAFGQLAQGSKPPSGGGSFLNILLPLLGSIFGGKK